MLPYLTASSVLFWQWTNNNNNNNPICKVPECQKTSVALKKRHWRSVFWGRRLKAGRQLFRRKKCIRWPGLRIFWPRNDLAASTSWRRHWAYTPTQQLIPAHVVTSCDLCQAAPLHYDKLASRHIGVGKCIHVPSGRACMYDVRRRCSCVWPQHLGFARTTGSKEHMPSHY